MAEVGSKATPGSSGHYTVAVKAPNGYRLRVWRMEKVRHARPGGYDEVEEARRDQSIPEHIVYGYAAAPGKLPLVPVRFGYAMNERVPAAVWEPWLEQNRTHPAVVNGLIFGFTNLADAEARAREMKEQLCGLEPMKIDEIDESGRIIGKPDPRAPAGLAVGRADVPRAA